MTIELARGEFTRDLADLSDDGDFRERQFEEAGLLRGRFVFCNQAAEAPVRSADERGLPGQSSSATPEQAGRLCAGL
ncbi:hypothetical protein [Candidatus Amarobacter glycogenicus]|uniref:hypothetical protein n=1 Tax=Candidatus Amarobacter glycogenicus TaxID=3140699 RepID=UPI002A106F05|nr:hypothetical protein [Dehalococcoidia bacterium]